MRTINTDVIIQKVKELFIDANYNLPCDICESIKASIEKEENNLSKNILSKLVENAECAKDTNVPVCQDTGMAVVFLEIGQDVHIQGYDLENAVNEGVRLAYNEGYLRKSVVCDPLFDRSNTNDNTPAVIYTKIVPGDKVKITACPKGFGSENMSRVKMFNPSATATDIEDFVLQCVKEAGGMPCPPIVVGVGIGGTFEYAAYLSKLALTRNINERNPNTNYANLEERLLSRINELDVGPQGFGGNTTALGVNIEYYPTHIAGLPVAVNIGCHVTRHKTCII